MISIMGIGAIELAIIVVVGLFMLAALVGVVVGAVFLFGGRRDGGSERFAELEEENLRLKQELARLKQQQT